MLRLDVRLNRKRHLTFRLPQLTFKITKVEGKKAGKSKTQFK